MPTVISQKQVAAFLKPRPKDSHKGDFGTVAIVGGGEGMIGAAFLAGRAALKLGAGVVHVGLLADKMPLVEIIMGEKTSAATLAKGFDYVQQIKKTPIVVNDSRGFYTSRVFGTYVMEGITMLAEGVHPRSIEVAGLQAGMPMPPLALQDEVSLSLSLHVSDQTRRDLEAEGKTYPTHPGEAVLRKLCVELGRVGKKAGKGFYDWSDPRNPRPRDLSQYVLKSTDDYLNSVK